jgi:hypothetical protein
VHEPSYPSRYTRAKPRIVTGPRSHYRIHPRSESGTPAGCTGPKPALADSPRPTTDYSPG